MLKRVAQKDQRAAREGCSKGLLRRVAKWCSVGASGVLNGSQWVSHAAYAGLRLGSQGSGECSDVLVCSVCGVCWGVQVVARRWACSNPAIFVLAHSRARVPGQCVQCWPEMVCNDHGGMAWVTCAACCRGAHSGFEREARVGYQGLRCVWCVCGARASSWRRGLERWKRVCAQRVAHVCVSRAGFF